MVFKPVNTGRALTVDEAGAYISDPQLQKSLINMLDSNNADFSSKVIEINNDGIQLSPLSWHPDVKAMIEGDPNQRASYDPSQLMKDIQPEAIYQYMKSNVPGRKLVDSAKEQGINLDDSTVREIQDNYPPIKKLMDITDRKPVYADPQEEKYSPQERTRRLEYIKQLPTDELVNEVNGNDKAYQDFIEAYLAEKGNKNLTDGQKAILEILSSKSQEERDRILEPAAEKYRLDHDPKLVEPLLKEIEERKAAMLEAAKTSQTVITLHDQESGKEFIIAESRQDHKKTYIVDGKKLDECVGRAIEEAAIGLETVRQSATNMNNNKSIDITRVVHGLDSVISSKSSSVSCNASSR